MTTPGNEIIGTADVNEKGTRLTKETALELFRHLEQFRAMTVELKRLLESEDYERTESVMLDRGEVLARMLELAGGDRRGETLSDETKEQCRAMVAHIETTTHQFKMIASEKESDLLTRLQQLQKQRSNQLYARQE